MSDNTDTNEDVSGLKNKITELHGLIKAEKARADRAEREREEAAEAATSANSTELEKAVKRAEKAERDFQAANERADKLENTRRNERADTLILKALNGQNVDTRHTSILSKALRGDVEFSDDGEPMIGGKSVEDFAKSYFGNKGEGHSYVRAPDNGGGAATGHDGTKTPRMTKENFSYGEFAKIQVQDPAEANAIADAIGRPELKTSI